MPVHERDATVRTAAGNLNAIIAVPATAPRAGLVLVDGSGGGDQA